MKYSEAILKALRKKLSTDKSVICYGLGVTDPKGVFGTTIDLHKEFGGERVFDMPTSENAMTGIGIGAAIMGNKVVMTHQRLDFFLLGLDQLVNAASKMHYMYGGELECPITIRLIIGRGWGQGPTHSQNLHAWFSHIPGLKVVMPTFPNDAYNLLIKSIDDPNPVIYLEHRWLHNTSTLLASNTDSNEINIGESRIVNEGSDYTIISSSYLTIEALKAASYLKEKHGLNIEVIDLISLKPIDFRTITASVKKTRRLCVIDSGFSTCSIASEIISHVAENHHGLLTKGPIKLAMPDCPEPTSFGLTKDFYIRAKDIAIAILDSLNLNSKLVGSELPEPTPHDVPGNYFNGPF